MSNSLHSPGPQASPRLTDTGWRDAGWQDEATLDRMLALHETPALPPGLVARIVREVPRQPQAPAVAPAPPQNRAACSARHAPGMASPLHLVSRHPRESLRPDFRAMDAATQAAPRNGRLSRMIRRRPKLGATAAGLTAAGLAGLGLFTLAINTTSGPAVPVGTAQSAPLALTPAANPDTIAGQTASAGLPPAGQNAMQGAIQGAGPGTALASRAQTVARPTLAPPAAVQAPALDDDDPNPSLTPVEPDTHMLAAESPDPGSQRAEGANGAMSPTLGASHGAMGPFVPQGYGFGGAIGGGPQSTLGGGLNGRAGNGMGGMGSGGPGGAGGPPPLP